MVGPIRGAALPMGFNRQPHYDRGLLLVGDAGGMVNPFNGEGIAYAMESGRLAAEVIAQALRARQRRRAASGRCRPTRAVMKDALGGYYTLGRFFVKMIGNPEVMRLATQYGLPRPILMRFVLKLHGQPRRAARRRRDGPPHQRPVEDGARRMTGRCAEQSACP